VALAATVLLAPGGFILGGFLIARAFRKRRATAAAVAPAKAGIYSGSRAAPPHEAPDSSRRGG
jgi:hypothetical protein